MTGIYQAFEPDSGRGPSHVVYCVCRAASAQSTTDKEPYIGAQASSEPDEAIEEEDDASLVPKGRHGGASHGGQTQQATQDNSTANAKKTVTNQPKKTQGSSQATSGLQTGSVKSVTGKSGSGQPRSYLLKVPPKTCPKFSPSVSVVRPKENRLVWESTSVRIIQCRWQTHFRVVRLD